MHKKTFLLFAAALFAMSAGRSALAQEWEHRREHEHEREREHGDIGRFHEHDFERWRGGRWFHGFHDAHDGWWWIVDGTWYFYPAPVYPYPDPYTPPSVVVQTVPGAAPQYWYCSNPSGYYPYVPRCYNPWQAVAGTAVVVPAPGAPPAAVVPAPQPQVVAPAAPQPVPQPMPGGTLHEMDYRQLNTFSAAFSGIDLNGRGASSQLKKLAAQVETFRRSLLHRDYNAMDIMRDTEDLKNRIAEEREHLRRHRAVAAPAPSTAVPSSPPEGAPPPGAPPQ
jgi:hypothetical protein